MRVINIHVDFPLIKFQEDAQTKILARLLRGTFYSLMGDTQKALDDLTEVFNDSKELDVSWDISIVAIDYLTYLSYAGESQQPY